MRDRTLTEPATSSPPSAPSTAGTPLAPKEFARWVEGHGRYLAERWLAEIRARDTVWNEEVEAIMSDFLHLLVSMIPGTLGPYRNQVEPLWVQTAELFGSVAAQRGLAAGEVIEEFQLLRDRLIRLLFESPPVDGGARMSLRDILRLNRVVDQGVTHASVGHTDALFFTLFQGSGVPETLDEELRGEVRAQLDGIREELGSLMAALER